MSPLRFARLALLGSLILVTAFAGTSNGPFDWRLTDAPSFGPGINATLAGPPAVMTENGLHFAQFDGKSAGYFIEKNPVEGCRTFTIEMQIRADRDGPPEPRFLNIDDNAGGRITMEFRIKPTGDWALDGFILQKAARVRLFEENRLHPGGIWHWVALVYDGKTLTSYVDAVKDLSEDVALQPMSEGKMSLGVRLNRVFWFKGGIARFKATPQALEPAQLQH